VGQARRRFPVRECGITLEVRQRRHHHRRQMAATDQLEAAAVPAMDPLLERVLDPLVAEAVLVALGVFLGLAAAGVLPQAALVERDLLSEAPAVAVRLRYPKARA